MINENANFVAELENELITRFKNSEIEVQRGVVGLTLVEAHKKFPKNLFRVGYVHTPDFRRNRMNVELQGDRISKVIYLG